MAQNSKIEWTEHTFNPWWGCVKVSPACTNCYADSFAKRIGKNVWGPKAPRRFLSDRAWAEPLRWNAAAEQTGKRARVFCASMGDVFEDRRDLDVHRERLWRLIAATPGLDWLLLTKRPQHVAQFAPWGTDWPNNVWLGVTVENQKAAAERLPLLVRVPAVLRFISAEPLFSALDLSPWIDRLDWVITGGESGARARIPNPAWFRGLRDQCRAGDVPFHFKQWGEWKPHKRRDQASGRIETALDGTTMQRVGKAIAGRRLWGKVWDQTPLARLG